MTQTPLPANVTILDLPAGTTIAGTELVESVQTAAGVANSVAFTMNQIATFVGTSIPAVLPSQASHAFLVGPASGVSTAVPTFRAMVNADLPTQTGLSVFGVVGTATAIGTAIAGTTDQVLRIAQNGTTLGFGAINLATSAAVTGVLAVVNGGIGFTTGTQSAVLGFLNATTATQFVVGQLPATSTSDSANSGNLGEFLSTTLAAGSARSLTSVTATSFLSISVPPGDWAIQAQAIYTFAPTTAIKDFYVAVSSNSASLGTGTPGIVSDSWFGNSSSTVGTSGPPALVSGLIRQSSSATTTIYGMVLMNFTTSTAGVYGALVARRPR